MGSKHFPRVLVVQHDLDDHLNELAGPLVEAGLSLEPWCTFASEEPTSRPEQYDAMISLGAIACVRDWSAQPWMAVEARYLEHLLASEKPILGVCFGSQLLAHVTGGEVYRSPRPEVGWTSVTATDAGLADALLGPFGATHPAFQFHADTFSLGDQATVLGRTGELIESFRVGKAAWGLQFHLEANPGVAYGWWGAYPDELSAAGLDLPTLTADTRRYWRDYRALCWGLAERFAALAA